MQSRLLTITSRSWYRATDSLLVSWPSWKEWHWSECHRLILQPLAPIHVPMTWHLFRELSLYCCPTHTSLKCAAERDLRETMARPWNLTSSMLTRHQVLCSACSTFIFLKHFGTLKIMNIKIFHAKINETSWKNPEKNSEKKSRKKNPEKKFWKKILKKNSRKKFWKTLL